MNTPTRLRHIRNVFLPLVWWQWPPGSGAMGLRDPSMERALLLTFFTAGRVGAVIIAAAAAGLGIGKQRSGWRKSAGLLGAGIIAYVITLPSAPYMTDVLKRAAPANPPAAQ